jgi:hypothetical protein
MARSLQVQVDDIPKSCAVDAYYTDYASFR